MLGVYDSEEIDAEPDCGEVFRWAAPAPCEMPLET